jgi:hypothetical protein
VITVLGAAGRPPAPVRLLAVQETAEDKLYLHPDRKSILDAGDLLSKHLRAPRRGQLRVV